MDPKSRAAFLALIALQMLHSIEEYSLRLYEVFPPARALSLFLSTNPRVGFAVANTGVVAFGLWCYVARIRPGRPSARFWAWAWVLLELGNGVGHTLFAIATGGYFPGVATAPLLFVVAAYLGALLWKSGRRVGERVEGRP